MARVAFGDFVLDLDTRELRRSGNAVALSPKAFQLLDVLVENRPRALSKRELQDCLWPETYVVEKNLTNLIAEIRAALGDDAANARFVRTIPRFGYAFHGEATPFDAPLPEIDRGADLLDRRRDNLPPPLTSFIGRSRELAELRWVLPSCRLLTLTGAGGCGKTRLAIELARQLVDEYCGGIWLVDVAPVASGSFIAQTIATVLDARGGPGQSIEDALIDAVRDRHLLLLLDNCEHLVEAVAHVIEALLRATRQLAILATSREALGIPGETVWRVPSLSTPDASEPISVEALRDSEAVALLLDRAAAAGAPVTPTTDNAATIADVCRRLDGIPLALELAAARLTVLSIHDLHARLHDRFRLLTGGSRTAVARQRTLEATVDWSYDLLSDAERRLLLRLSVFSGGWLMETAEEVCADPSTEGPPVLDLLTRLADKSLVIVEQDATSTRRQRLLETVRQYARDRLLQSGDAERTRDRHFACFFEIVQHAERELTRHDQVRWLNLLDAEHDNLRTALEWSLSTPERWARGLEMAGSLSWFWVKRGYFAEGQRWLERALAAGRSSQGTVQARALFGVGIVMFFQGDFMRTRAAADESAALARAAGDATLTALALGIGAIAALELGELEAGTRLAAEGRAAGARSPTPWVQGPSLSFFGYQALHAGDLDRAGRLHEEVLDLARRQGEKWVMTIALFDLGLLRILQGRSADARPLCYEALTVCEQFRDRRGIAWCFGILAAAELLDGHARRAAILRSAMGRLLGTVGASVQPTFKQWIDDRYLSSLPELLGREGDAQAQREGRAMSIAEAIAFSRS